MRERFAHGAGGVGWKGAMLLAAATLQGCIVVPNLAPIKGDKEAARITIGETSRDEVVEILGQPNVTAGEDFLVYNWEKSRTFVVWGAGYSGGAAPAGHRGFRVIVEFDANDLVVDLLTARSKLQAKQLPEKMKRLRDCDRIGPMPNAVALSTDGEQIAVLRQNKLCVVRLSSPESVKIIDIGKTKWIAGLTGAFISFSPDGSLLAAALFKQRPSIWDVETGLKIRDFGVEKTPKEMKWLPPRPVAFSPDGRRLIAPDGKGSVVVWEIEDGAEVFRFTPSSRVVNISFVDDGDLIALGLWGGGVEILDAKRGVRLMLREALPKSSAITAVAFSPDGRWLALGTTVHLELWSLASLRDQL